MKSALLPCRSPGKRHPDWRKLYQSQCIERMPWYHAALDPDIERELSARKLSHGRFLDVGTGPGTQAMHLAHLGFDVTGTDLSPVACAQAKRLCPSATFIEDDILATRLQGGFDFAFDRGCFHVLEAQTHAKYVATLSKLLVPGGLLFLKCFSEENGPSDWGPLRLSPDDITSTFEPAFRIEAMSRTVYQGSSPSQPKALFVVMRNLRL